ncbi:MAG: hypothetical protein AB7F66_11765 [Bacteriovoracia bacterium]
MRVLEAILVFFQPTLRIRPDWKHRWDQNERLGYRPVSFAYFSLFLIAYVAHYYLIDIPLGKQPIELWAKYRFFCSGVALTGLALSYYKPVSQTRFFRLPIVVSGLIFSYMQGLSMEWRPEVPYFYSILIPVITTLTLSNSIFFSSTYLLVAYCIQLSFFLARTGEHSYILSAAIVGLVATVAIRSTFNLKVTSFIFEQERLETQKKLIELQIEMNEQIRSFLPKEIYNRLNTLITDKKQTVTQAINEVLRSKVGPVACLYTDIRSFSTKSKDLRGFLGKSAIPNLRSAVDTVEEFDGIPRVIGDLVFAYFDQVDPQKNIINALRAACAIAQKTLDANQRVSDEQKTERFICVSFGEAVTGNIGGTESSREITALGQPANIVNRIDLLTKDATFKSILKRDVILLTESAAICASKALPHLELKSISLAEINLSIKDFPEERQLGVLEITPKNLLALENSTEITPLLRVA